MEVLLTSARRGVGVGALLDRVTAVADGGPVHAPVMARQEHLHDHEHGTHTHTAASGAMAQSGS